MPENYFRCMNPKCDIEFDRTALRKHLGASFMNKDFKRIREALLFETEKSFFPATQMILERDLEIERLHLSIKDVSLKYEAIREVKLQELITYMRSDSMAPICDTINQYVTMIESTNIDDIVNEETESINDQINHLRHSTVLAKTFIRQCSNNECMGMLSKENCTPANNYKCALCQSITCNACRETLKDESTHTCNKDTLDTIKFIEDTSKPCPSCGTRIHKLHGCFDKNIIIPLANGLNKCANEIIKGDQLIGDDLQLRTVLHTFNGVDQLYRVIQEHGETYIVNSKHNLVLAKANGKQYIIDLTTYMKLPDAQKAELFGFKINAGQRILSKLSISAYKFDSYFGFELDGNNKFLYTDGTVLSNCNQMWCTNCQISFAWTTLKIINGTIHNPHYFEWQRTKNISTRDPLDIQCGNELTHDHIVNIQRTNQYILNNTQYNNDNEKNDIYEKNERMNSWLQKIIHLHQDAIPRYQGTTMHARNQSLRLQLLRKLITETEFRIKIQRIDKAESKKQDILNVLVTFRDVATDITQRMLTDIRVYEHFKLEHVMAYYGEFEALSQYISKCLYNIIENYGSNMSTNILNY